MARTSSRTTVSREEGLAAAAKSNPQTFTRRVDGKDSYKVPTSAPTRTGTALGRVTGWVGRRRPR